jgi:hypothetical protein
VSGVLGLAVRHGAITHNPVREIERIESRPRRRAGQGSGCFHFRRRRWRC